MKIMTIGIILVGKVCNSYNDTIEYIMEKLNSIFIKYYKCYVED
jgi:hypothetical protein